MLQIFFCCIFWTLILGYISFRFVSTSKQAFIYLDRLHQIPCSRCVFFTGDYRLKCTVHPVTALTEESINCRDFIADFKGICESQSLKIDCNCYQKYFQTSDSNF